MTDGALHGTCNGVQGVSRFWFGKIGRRAQQGVSWNATHQRERRARSTQSTMGRDGLPVLLRLDGGKLLFDDWTYY